MGGGAGSCKAGGCGGMGARASEPAPPTAGERGPCGASPGDDEHFGEGSAALGGSQKAEAARGTGREEAASRRTPHRPNKAPAPPAPPRGNAGAGGLQGEPGLPWLGAGRGPQHREGCRELWGAPLVPACPSAVHGVWKGVAAGGVAWVPLESQGWGRLPTFRAQSSRGRRQGPAPSPAPSSCPRRGTGEPVPHAGATELPKGLTRRTPSPPWPGPAATVPAGTGTLARAPRAAPRSQRDTAARRSSV